LNNWIAGESGLACSASGYQTSNLIRQKGEMACVNVKKYSTDQKQVCYNCGQMEQGRCRIRCYSTFDEENRAECIRRAELSFEERWREFAALQARVFGKAWTETPMVRQIRVERLNWY